MVCVKNKYGAPLNFLKIIMLKKITLYFENPKYNVIILALYSNIASFYCVKKITLYPKIASKYFDAIFKYRHKK